MKSKLIVLILSSATAGVMLVETAQFLNYMNWATGSLSDSEFVAHLGFLGILLVTLVVACLLIVWSFRVIMKDSPLKNRG